MRDMEGRTVFITGASRGIGAAMALRPQPATRVSSWTQNSSVRVRVGAASNLERP
jgi:hypothetical protein